MNCFKKIFIFMFLIIGIVPFSYAQKHKKKKTHASKIAKTNKKTNKSPKIVTAPLPVPRIERASLNDTSNPKEVIITSAFKPTLKTAAKINFTAASFLIDTNKLSVNYKIPSQNLFFSYQPVSIKPIAMNMDTIESWQNDHFVKLGLGNFSSPFAELGLSFGDHQKSSVVIHANHISAKGNLAFQQFSKTGFDVYTIFNTASQHEWTAKAFYNTNTQYFYGMQPKDSTLTKDNLLQRFHNVGLAIGVQNKQIGNYSLTYQPQLSLNYFVDNRNANETNLIAKIPLTKSFGNVYAFKLGLSADIANYKANLNNVSITNSNNLFYLDPTIIFKTPNFKLNVGVLPSWDNNKFALLPNMSATIKIVETDFHAELGWQGYFQKNSYRSLAGFNPWIQSPTNILNTKISEQYIGFKGSTGNHLTYQARLSFLQLYNQPLFVNNYTDGRSFNILYDPKIQALRIHGELGYLIQEKFSFIGALNLNEYTQVTNSDKAYGLIPLDFSGTFKWKIRKDLQVKAEAYFKDGTSYQTKSLQSFKLNPAADLNLGTEFSIAPKLNLWLQLNNLLNNKYQRWNQYEVLGFSVLGGVVYSFQ